MFDPDVVGLDQPFLQAAPDPGPREAASMHARSNWSNWSNLFIELVKLVLGIPATKRQTLQHTVCY